MSHDDWLEQADVYALGALDGEERSRFEDHLSSGCPDCEQRLRESQEAVALLTRSLPAQTPAPRIKKDLMDQIARESRAPLSRSASRSPRRPLSWSRLAVAATVLAALFLGSFLVWDNLNMRRQIGGHDAETARLQNDIARRKEIYRLLEDSEVRTIALAGLAPSPSATGRLLWKPTDRTGVLLTRGLPEAPTGQTYALWAIAATGPVPAGLFNVDKMGRAQFRVNLPVPASGPFQQFAVTLEPASGGPKPTGPMHLLSTLGPKGPA
jgi:anti-sigma-K factor RskA